MEPIFKQPEHLESISVENMDLNKSFAFFDIEIPPFSVTHVKLIETKRFFKYSEIL